MMPTWLLDSRILVNACFFATTDLPDNYIKETQGYDTPFYPWDRFAIISSQYSLYRPLERGVYCFHLVHLSISFSIRLSICGQNCLALYLQQYSSDTFHICTSYQTTSAGVLHVKVDSIVWVITRRKGVSSKCRHSSCYSSHLWFTVWICVCIINSF